MADIDSDIETETDTDEDERVERIRNEWALHQERQRAPVVCTVRLAILNGATVDAVRAAVERDPGALMRQDAWGWTPLHWAIFDCVNHGVEGYEAIIEYLVERFPAALQMRTTDLSNYLPIHVACMMPDWCRLDEGDGDRVAQIVRILLANRPETAQELVDGTYPLELIGGLIPGVARRIVEAWPEAIAAVYDSGNFLLHNVVECPRDSAEEMSELVEVLVTHRPSIVRQRDSHGRIALHCISFTPPDVVLYLLNQWRNSVRQRDDGGYLPLHCLVDIWNGDDDGDWNDDDDWLHVLDEFCRQCPRAAGIRTFHGKTPLAIAAQRDSSLRVIRTLVHAWRPSVRTEDSYDRLPIHLLFTRESWSDPHLTPIAQFLIQEYPRSLRKTTYEGDLPLHALTKATGRQPDHIKTELVELLVNAAPDSVRLPDRKGLYPLHYAVRNGFPFESVQRLLWAATDACEFRDRSGWTALHHAVARSQASLEQVEYLVQQCPASTQFTTNDGSTALLLELARRAPRLIMVTFLVQKDRDSLLTSNRRWMAPVHVATTHNDTPEALQYLIEQEPQALHLPDRTGSLALHTALRLGKSLDFVRPLVEGFPESAGHADRSGSLPLHVLLASGFATLEKVRYLVEHQPPELACMHHPNRLGYLPLHVAALNDTPLDVLFFLVRNDPKLIHGLRASKKRKR